MGKNREKKERNWRNSCNVSLGEGGIIFHLKYLTETKCFLCSISTENLFVLSSNDTACRPLGRGGIRCETHGGESEFHSLSKKKKIKKLVGMNSTNKVNLDKQS